MAFDLGFIIGPWEEACFSKYGLRVPFTVALFYPSQLVIWIFFPESLPPENREFDIKRLTRRGSFVKMKNILLSGGLLLAVFFIYGISCVQSHWGYFGKYRFNWDEATIGYSLGAVWVISGAWFLDF